jgi:hypothetical protein
MILSSTSKRSAPDKDQDVDPVMLGFLKFLDGQMTQHPDLIEPVDRGATPPPPLARRLQLRL